MRLYLSLTVVAILALWLQLTTTAPAQVISASFADQSDSMRQRPQKRSDDDDDERSSTTRSPANSTNGSAGRRDDLEQMEQHVLREMFQMDVLPEEDRLDSDHESSYMLELYNEVADNHTGILRPRKSGKQPVLTENVRSLPARATTQMTGGHWRLTFDSSGLPAETERIQYATLAMYSRHCQPGWRNTTAGQRLKVSGVHKTNISVYASIHKNYAELTPLHVVSQRLKLKGKCWHVFDETRSVQAWQARRRRGMRHFIVEQQGYDNLDADDFLHLQGEGDARNRPVLVIYSGKRVYPPARTTKRRRRDVPGDFGHGAGGPPRQINGDPIRGIHHTECARRELVIDFTKSGWHKWIISPPKYKAYRCAGTCKFPIHDSIRSTLHARLEASVTYQNEINGIKDPLAGSGACCVPTAHTSVSLLFHTRSGGTLLHIANKMVADRCGCR